MSTAHSRALHAHLRAGGNEHDQSNAPANPKRVIERSSPDESLRGTETHGARRKRLAEGQSRSETPGAFDKLRTAVRSHYQENGGPGADESGFDVNEQIRRLKAQPKAPAPGTITKALKPAFAKLANTIGTPKAKAILKSLEAGAGTDSATLTGGAAMRKQSIGKKIQSTATAAGVGKTMNTTAPKKPTCSPSHLLKAASAALHAGQITGADAQAIQSQVDLTGTCSPALMAKLTGEKPPTAEPLMTKSHVLAAIKTGIVNGIISGAEAQHVDECLSLDRPVNENVMTKVRAIHKSK